MATKAIKLDENTCERLKALGDARQISITEPSMKQKTATTPLVDYMS